ncbi:hypothetical protein THTE_2892 [Thermogutta terrifontis]|uniref:Uncharacterized protein n=1 Tax=Thermogutta terrifontis TaxID=1331910 RepID=A0A286RHP6_9BACT|nr:hypothetical protein THTE_2892 [Thermogutta terrifontis]
MSITPRVRAYTQPQTRDAHHCTAGSGGIQLRDCRISIPLINDD